MKNMLIGHMGEDRCIVIDSEFNYPFLNCTYALVNTWNYEIVFLWNIKWDRKNRVWYFQNNREEYGCVAHRNV